MLDDLNTSGALGHTFSLVRAANVALDAGAMSRPEAEAIVVWLREVDTIWAVLPPADALVTRRITVGDTTLLAIGPAVAEEVLELIVARVKARAERDFAAADELRDRLGEHNVVVEDTPQGARWYLATG